MAITEILFPRLKTDKSSIDEVERLWPTAVKAFTDPNPGLLSAFRGWMLSEDGNDQREAFREVAILGEAAEHPVTLYHCLMYSVEWREASDFHDFLAGSAFASFAGSIKHLVNGPPTLQLFHTNTSPKEAGRSQLTEIIQVHMTDTESSLAAVEAWSSFVETTSAHGVAYGKSSNLADEIFVGLIGWANTEVSSVIQNALKWMLKLMLYRSKLLLTGKRHFKGYWQA